MYDLHLLRFCYAEQIISRWEVVKFVEKAKAKHKTLTANSCLYLFRTHCYHFMPFRRTHNTHLLIPARPWSIIVITHHRHSRKRRATPLIFIAMMLHCLGEQTRCRDASSENLFMVQHTSQRHNSAYTFIIPPSNPVHGAFLFYLFTSTFRIEIIKWIMRRFPQIFLFSSSSPFFYRSFSSRKKARPTTFERMIHWLILHSTAYYAFSILHFTSLPAKDFAGFIQTITEKLAPTIGKFRLCNPNFETRDEKKKWCFPKYSTAL